MKKCKFCSEDIQDKAIKCRFCGEYVSENKPVSLKGSELNGLGGWLIVIIIGIIIRAIYRIITIDEYYISSVNDGTFGVLTDPYSSQFIQGLEPLLYFEVIGNSLLIIFELVLIYLFFCKHINFPLLFKIYLLTSFSFVLLDNIWYSMIPDFLFTEDEEGYLPLLQEFMYMIIWGSYMHKSIRVKNTFTNKLYENKNVLGIIIIIILGLGFLSIILNIYTSKINYTENDHGTETCYEHFGYNSYYTGQKEDGVYLCDCNEGYDFGEGDNSICIKVK